VNRAEREDTLLRPPDLIRIMPAQGGSPAPQKKESELLRRAVCLSFLLLVACETAENKVVVLTHESFAAAVKEETFGAFTAQTGATVEVVTATDAGTLVNQAVLSKDNPVADLLFGVDDTFLSRAIDAGIFQPFESDQLSTIPLDLQLDKENNVTPIDYGDVCINYDKEALSSAGLQPPTGLDELTNPEYAGLLVVEHPALSSPGLAFLLTTVDLYGEEGFVDYWNKLKANGVEVAADWNIAYHTEFSGGSGEGDKPLVVSYASSPPAEVIFADPQPTEAPTGAVAEGCYRQVEFAGVLAGSRRPGLAGRLIDFMLTKQFQETIPLTWFVYPANSEAALPDEFVAHTVVPVEPVQMDPSRIDANREKWIAAWREVMEG